MADWPGIYNSGSATVEADGTTVVFQNAGNLAQAVRPGDRFGGHWGLLVRIASVSATTITLAAPWPGPSQTEEPYEIVFTPYDSGYRQALEILLAGVQIDINLLDGILQSMPDIIAVGAASADVALLAPLADKLAALDAAAVQGAADNIAGINEVAAQLPVINSAIAAAENAGSFATLALANAAAGTIPLNKGIYVTGDPAAPTLGPDGAGEGNGYYENRTGSAPLYKVSNDTPQALAARTAAAEAATEELDARQTAQEVSFEASSGIIGDDRLVVISAQDGDGRKREIGHWKKDATFHAPQVAGGSGIFDFVRFGDVDAFAMEIIGAEDAVYFVDQNNRIIKTLKAMPVGREFQTSEAYPVIGLPDGRAVFTDGDDRVMGILPSIDLDPLMPEMVAARGVQPSLAARIDRSLDGYGNLKGATENLDQLRRSRVFLGRLDTGVASTQFPIGFLGDSRAYLAQISHSLGVRLRKPFGYAGGGYINFNGAMARPHALIGEYATSYSAAFQFFQNSVATPDMSYTKATVAGSVIVVSCPAGLLPSEVAWVYMPVPGTSVSVSYNDGTWSADISTADGVGPSRVVLPAPPSGVPVTKIEIRQNSGLEEFNGLHILTEANGLRFNKFGQNGAVSGHFRSKDEAQFIAAHAMMPCGLYILSFGTNNQSATSGAAAIGAALAVDYDIIAQRLRAASPGADILIAMPSENFLGRDAPMSEITVPVREMCVAKNYPFIDLQPYFGLSLDDYSPTSPLPALPDNTHEDALFGGPLVADALYRALVHSL
ncbi:hypothetical protein [Tianweitania sediminis]|uniref:SGNH hydrolase-type esterase domain-containing protein n=1 Tax=Tianweitania sediminis TaxID=1502156 RepID=A0A8J7R244_9HYPH|nr:hypothetical protein [Tianweitania sediminis]MBP0439423.1 hypothetical protein [Tianweitania sediminis]